LFINLMATLQRRLGVSPRLLREAISFLVVGVGSTATYSVTVVAMVETLGFGVIAATTAAFVTGTAFSYVGNSIVSFRRPMDVATLMRFSLVTFAGFILNLLIAAAVHGLGWHYAVGIALVVVTVPVFNFVGHKLFTYRRPPAPAVS
jgi:putative flippase GtrA